jgi:cytochrome c-type biogenesis protein CcmH
MTMTTPLRAALALALLAAPAAAQEHGADAATAAPTTTAPAASPSPSAATETATVADTSAPRQASTALVQRIAAVETPESKAVAQEAIGRLRSPFCPGLMLEVCPSPPAELFRDTLHLLAAEGRTADELVEWALARHGEEWRAVPKRSGTGLLAWLIPPAMLLAGVGFVAMRLRRWRRDEGPYAPGAAAPLSDDERAALDAAMADLEREQREAGA